MVCQTETDVVMTALQKATVIVALAAFAGAAIYETHRASALEAQLQALRQQQERLAEQVEQSHRERDARTQPESLLAQNQKLSTNQSADQSRELLRLRGEVSVLKRQVAELIDHTLENQVRPQLSQNPGSWTEADLNDQQRKSLADWTEKLKTGNSVADLARLKDSLDRWDELMVNPAPPEQKPVLAILKEKLKERIAELESQK